MPERNDAAIWEIVVRPYRAVYRLRDGAVQIVAVFRVTLLLTLPTEH